MLFRLPTALPLFVLAAGVAFADNPQTPTQSDSQARDTTRSRPRVRFGGFSVGAGYSYFSGPFFYPYGYYPYRTLWGPYSWYPGYWGYDPFFYGAFIHPGFFTGYGYQPSMGEIRLRSADKDAWVYLDGALAGKAEKLKNMWLEPGAYNLEVRSGQKQFSQKVYVLSGKTLRLTADPERGQVRP